MSIDTQEQQREEVTEEDLMMMSDEELANYSQPTAQEPENTEPVAPETTENVEVEHPTHELTDEQLNQELEQEDPAEDMSVQPDPDVRYIVKRSDVGFGTLWYSGPENGHWDKRQHNAKELTQAELDELKATVLKDVFGKIDIYLKTIVPTVKWVRQ